MFVFLCILILFIVLVLLLRSLFFIANIEGGSMCPTLEHGDQVIVLKNYFPSLLRRGQIIVLRVPSNCHHKQFMIKRIIGLPGDRIVSFQKGNEYFVFLHNELTITLPEKQIWDIPPQHVFVRGDCLQIVFDSLRWGPIPFSKITGIVIGKRSRLGSLSPK